MGCDARGRGCFPVGQELGLAADAFGVAQPVLAAVRERGGDALLRVLVQKLQHADEVPPAGAGSVAGFQLVTELTEARGQVPVAVDRGVIQRRRPPRQGDKVVVRVEDLLAATVAAWMLGHDLASGHDGDVSDIGLDRDRLESLGVRHAVAVVLEAHGLVLVDLRRLGHAGIKGVCGQGQRCDLVPREADADGLGLFAAGAFALGQAALVQVGVQRRQIADLGDRRGPAALQIVDAVLDARLLVAAPRHAEQGLEGVVAGQGRVAWLETPLAPGQDGAGHRGRVVPPDFARDAAKEGESLDETVQDGLGAFAGQRQGEGAIGVGPGDQQHRHLPPAVGEIDVDVAEVGLDPLSSIVAEGNERLALLQAPALDVAAHLVVAAGVAVLGLQAAKDLHGRVALLAGACSSAARMASMTPKNAPSLGAGYGSPRWYGLGSGWARAFRTLRRER